jgi:hypothetical protein
MLATFHVCGVKFKVAEPLEHLPLVCGVLSKVSFNHFISSSSHFVKFCLKFNTIV